MFKKDLERLTSELKATNNAGAVVQRYANALHAKLEVRFESSPNSPRLRISKAAQELERLEKLAKADRRAMLTATRERRIDQYGIAPCTGSVLWFSSLPDPRILDRLADEGWHEEISSRRGEYVQYIAGAQGAYVARPLTEKGTNTRILRNAKL